MFRKFVEGLAFGAGFSVSFFLLSTLVTWWVAPALMGSRISEVKASGEGINASQSHEVPFHEFGAEGQTNTPPTCVGCKARDHIIDAGYGVATYVETIKKYVKATGQGTQNSFEALKHAAEHGEANAQFALGMAYADGNDRLGVTQNDAEAVKWVRKAAEQENANAQILLGMMYQGGRGVAQDAGEAMKWYHKAANQRDANAQFILGELYANGYGVARDEAEAMKWYRLAAKQGNKDAQTALATIKNHPTSAAQQKESAQDPEALNNVPVRAKLIRIQDFETTKRAAEQGDADAQFALGEMYANGQGVARDETEAMKWYRKAAAQGYKLAQAALAAMKK